MTSQFGFSEEEVGSIKRLVEIAIKQGGDHPLARMFPGEGRLQEEANMLYLQMKGAKFTLRPSPKDPRDMMVGAMQPTDLSRADLRVFCSPVENQRVLNSCTANAAVGAIELLQQETNKAFVDESRLYIYYNTRELEDNVAHDDGAYIRDVLKALAKHGSCKESLWPYDSTKWAERPPASCYAEGEKYLITSYMGLHDGDVQQAKSVLAAGRPVIFGMYVYEEFQDTSIMKTGKLPMPGKNSKNLGGHAILLVGFDEASKVFYVRNSWGPAWGDKGYFYMPYDYYKGYCFDAWTINGVPKR